METAPTVPAAQSADLENLKTKTTEGITDALKFAREVDAYFRQHRTDPQALARELGKSRSWLVQLMGFLKLPQDVLQNIEDTALSYSELQELKALPEALRLQVSQEIKAGSLRPGRIARRCDDLLAKTPASAPAANTETDKTNSTNTTNNETNNEFEGYPLLRDTVDELVKLLTFWRHQLHLGEILERWLIKGRDTGWVKVGFSGLAVGCALYGGYNAGELAWHKGADILWRLSAPAGSSGPAGAIAAGPQIVQHDLIDRNRLRLRWSSAGPNMSYRVYYHPAGADFDDPVGQDISTLGADVDISPLWKKALITVTAIAPNGHESPHSAGITFVLKPENQNNSITPLEEEGEAANQPSSGLRPPSPRGGRPTSDHPNAVGPLPLGEGRVRAPVVSAPPSAPNVAVPIPTEVHYELKTPDLIILRWRPVGPSGIYSYNVYSSAKSDLSALRKENTAPMKLSVVTWTPETGLDTYWIVVTALDAQGHESGYSEAIEVVRHPEKSGSSTMDKATDVIKKVLPW